MKKIDNTLVLSAMNAALTEQIPFKDSDILESLDSEKKSNPAWSCNNFAPATLGYVEKLSESSPVTNEYKKDTQLWPTSFSDDSFVNFSIMFQDSSSNHNFNVYFDKEGFSYRIQVYINEAIRISTKQNPDEFIKLWKQLNTDTWMVAYKELFYVEPKVVGNAYTNQYVTIITSN